MMMRYTMRRSEGSLLWKSFVTAKKTSVASVCAAGGRREGERGVRAVRRGAWTEGAREGDGRWTRKLRGRLRFGPGRPI